MAKYMKIGAVLRNANGPFLVLGNTKNKDPKYNYSVELTVRDHEGKVVSQLNNAAVTLSDPRKRPGITEEAAARIPESVRFEVLIKTE